MKTGINKRAQLSMIMDHQENKDLVIFIAFLKIVEVDREKNNYDWLGLTLKNCTSFKLIKNAFEYVATIDGSRPWPTSSIFLLMSSRLI